MASCDHTTLVAICYTTGKWGEKSLPKKPKWANTISSIFKDLQDSRYHESAYLWMPSLCPNSWAASQEKIRQVGPKVQGQSIPWSITRTFKFGTSYTIIVDRISLTKFHVQFVDMFDMLTYGSRVKKIASSWQQKAGLPRNHIHVWYGDRVIQAIWSYENWTGHKWEWQIGRCTW